MGLFRLIVVVLVKKSDEAFSPWLNRRYSNYLQIFSYPVLLGQENI